MSIRFNTNCLGSDSPAKEHLRCLGYKDGDKVYYRGIFPRNGQKRGQGQNATATFPSLPPNLKNWQAEGRGVYMVVNSGGHKDEEITHCRAVFYEHDDLEKNLSRDLWRSLNLPSPTFQVDTGNKSIHSYWVFDEPISPNQWKALQSDLLEFADADRSLKNPSRVMRLAGFLHPETGRMATIIGQEIG